MHDLGGAIEPSVTQFVDLHVSSLLTWDVLVFFHGNPSSRVDLQKLAGLLGRGLDELEPEVTALCDSGILQHDGDTITYRPNRALRDTITAFADSCQDPRHRLALIAMVLQRSGRTT